MAQMEGLVAIVTGASRGLGKAIALEYGREGAKVVVCARPQSPTSLPGTAYSVSKAALHMLSHVLAEEMREYNIAINIISPGSLKSEGSSVIPWNLRNWDSRIEPSENGPGVVFLALQTAQSMTGQYVHRDDFGKTWGPGVTPAP